MRSFIIASVIALATLGARPTQAQVNFQVSVGTRDGFNLEIGNFYRVPPREVIIVRDRHIDDDEIPVVFFFADAAGVRPELIADMRHHGMSWRDIAFRFRLNPQIFYFPDYGVTYDFGRYHSYRDWYRIPMRDDDFVRFANVRFISKHYNRPPAEVLRMHDRDHSFYSVHNEVYRDVHRDNGYHNGDRHDGDRHDNGVHNGDRNHEFKQDNGQADPGRGHDRNWRDNNDSRRRRDGDDRN